MHFLPALLLFVAPPLTIHYPADKSVFPPEIAAPTFLWSDNSPAKRWRFRVEGSGAAKFETETGGGEPYLGPPGSKGWKPQPAEWERIKRIAGAGAEVTVDGLDEQGVVRSSAKIRIRTAREPAGAPIFYRDVPLMPSRTKLGTISPLAPDAIRLVAWRLRDISQPSSRLLMQGLPTCANCHSFSRDGKTMGIDVDGPDSDKGTYAVAEIAPRMTIRNSDVMTWNSFAGKRKGQRTIGFMSQISPDGRYAISTVNESVYAVNFMDFRFLQVFYPTRGILAVFDRESRRIQALPGADDPAYVHTGAAWSADGQYLVFSRAEARDPYPEGRPLPKAANEAEELPVKYSLYRIPFNGGRGGKAEPIQGASNNGVSNTFPKVSPDGKWIVFVRCRNGQLMRPDSELYIIPAAGGNARRMNCNTPLMNSWHSFSPNGRWLVFSSKSRSPYTQMFLTYLDENGMDTPPILIENSTAPDRAVNIPEFVNIPPDGLFSIDVPAADFYRLYDQATALTRAGEFEKALKVWRKAVEMEPDDARGHNNLGVVLTRLRRQREAAQSYRRAIEADPGYTSAHFNLGAALWSLGEFAEALRSWEEAARLSSNNDPEILDMLAGAYSAAGRTAEADATARRALRLAEKLGDSELAAAIRGKLAGAAVKR